ncbi:sigma-E processing peptidase SpoIIGA [Clostridium sp. E02]|uniref:sigma-E processing peptidase SpoIIGA n=1 Tax=Clostridium sp. E02 TaxID=2487134 RepID=UPI000F54B35C|nr:sigma-E processing peptidase SpoIIGA [Clostridium sp. E02]
MVLTNSERNTRYNVRTGQEVNAATEINLYIDVLFLVNFIMDLFILSIVRRGMKYPMIRWRIILGSALGAVWAVIVTAFPIFPQIVEMIMTYFVISILMVITAFNLKKPKEIGKAVSALYLSALVIGGIMSALYQHTKAGYYIEQILRGNGQGAIPFYRLIFLAAGTYFGIRALLRWILPMMKEKSNFYEVTMHYKGKEKKVTALLDTGNRLYEPVSRKPVHVVTYEAVKELCESVSEVIYIPFGSVGKTSGMMPGIFLDEMEIRQGDVVKVIKKPLIAVCKKTLSGKGEYQMLLHEE